MEARRSARVEVIEHRAQAHVWNYKKGHDLKRSRKDRPAANSQQELRRPWPAQILRTTASLRRAQLLHVPDVGAAGAWRPIYRSALACCFTRCWVFCLPRCKFVRAAIQDIDRPPQRWSDLKYVFWHQGGPRCRGRSTHPMRLSQSCDRLMCWCRRARP